MCTYNQKYSREQLKIIAIRPLKECADYILRALHPGQTYYFNQNFRVNEEGICKFIGNLKNQLPCDFFHTGKMSANSHTPLIYLNAIVGKNGDGKSSLVELLMRIINNLSYKIFTIIQDQQYVGNYIDRLHAELYYAIEHTILLNGEPTVTWKFYRIIINEQEVKVTLQNELLMADNGINMPISPETVPLNKSLLENLFYTFINNYSVFAYNVYDFCKEWEEDSDYETCWLHHLFHKNDGYQLPIVLHPFRDRGNIQVNTEHNLIKSRLIALLIEPPKSDSVNFRIINEKHKVKSIDCKLPEIDVSSDDALLGMCGTDDCKGWSNKKYIKIEKEWLKSSNDLAPHPLMSSSLPDPGSYEIITFDRLENSILQQWSEIYDLSINTDYSNNPKRKRIYFAAMEYIVYKTISVTRTYKSYMEFLYLKPDYAKSEQISFEGKLKLLVKKMADDSSHVTLKIRQTIAFLKFQIDTWDCDMLSIPPSILYDRLHPHLGTDELGNTWELIELLPPPIFDIEIKLHNNLTDQEERFSSLSSGERQLIYSVSSILYHLRNINSVKSNFHSDNLLFAQENIHYRHVNLILEEVELYFHPEFQCQYVKYLLDSIYSINLPEIESINITFVTHSPFVLSDITLDNVLFLKNGLPVTKMQENTFGANIYNLYKNGFFLNGAPVGGFAKEKIRQLFERLQVGEASPQLMNEIRLIGEPLIKNQLIKYFNQNLPQVNEERIQRLEEELRQLKGGQR